MYVLVYSAIRPVEIFDWVERNYRKRNCASKDAELYRLLENEHFQLKSLGGKTLRNEGVGQG